MHSRSTPPFHAGAERSAAPGSSLFLFIALTLLSVAGCQAPHTGKPVPQNLSGSDPDAIMNFWHELTDEPIASNDQAFRALLLYLDGKDDSADYNARVRSLRDRHLLPAHFNEPAQAAVKRGTLAVAILHVLHEHGGVTTRVFGATPRYAVRELMFMDVYPPSTANQAFSGNELVGIIGRVEDFQRGNPADVPAAVMPGQMTQKK